uniref:Serpentine receptor class gamma n=1 Tax=Panagrellus redivivus TaxID=6233 RepID=A0A7E4V1J1_PANRE
MSLFLGNAADFGFGHSGDALWHAFGLLCVPTCIIGVVLAFCAGLRYLLKNSTATESVTLWRLEMINGLQASIIALQLGVVKYHTNSGVLYIYSIIIQVIFAHVNGGVAANPIDIITKFRSREITRMTAIGCGIIQLFVPVIVRLLVWLCKNDLFFVMIDTCKVEMVYEHIDVIVFEIMISILLTLISCNTTGTVKKWVMPIATSSLQAIGKLYVLNQTIIF